MGGSSLDELADRELERTMRAARPKDQPQPQFRTIGDIAADARPVPWLIKRYLEQATTACLFGDPESGKSLLALDWGMHIAAGRAWHGNPVTQGAVFLLCGEGREGLRRRARAWSIRNGIALPDLPVYAHTVAIDVSDPTAAYSVGSTIERTAAEYQQTPRLIVIDTLSRHLGGDENSTADVARFIAHVDAHVREPTGAAVLLVHHTGHGDKSRARGSTVLRGAMDTEYRMTREPESRAVRLECTKAKDWPHPEPTHYAIRVVELGLEDDDGEPVTSAVLDLTDAPIAPKLPTSGNQGKAIAALQRLVDEGRARLIEAGRDPSGARVTVTDWREAAGIDRRRWPEVFHALTSSGRVTFNAPFVSIAGVSEC